MKSEAKIKLEVALEKADKLLKSFCLSYSICGSVRRKKREVSDVDVLIELEDSDIWMEGLKKLNVQWIRGGNYSFDIIFEEILFNFRAVPPESWGAGLLFLTGSKELNIRMRVKAMKEGLTLNQYGLFKDNKNIASKTEREIFEKLKMEFIPPEKRE